MDLAASAVEAQLDRAFRRELAAGYEAARSAQERLLGDPSDTGAVAEVGAYFHRIAGTADMVQRPMLGHLAAIVERLADEVAADRFADRRAAARMFARALAAVAVELTASGEAPLEPAKTANALDALGQPGDLGAEAQGPKILVVDDDRVSAELVDRCLRSNGFESALCCDPRRAISMIEEAIPDLIVLDVLMPDIDGFELCRRIRERPAWQLIPIIFVTRKGDLVQRVRGLEVGANDYIAKPFEPVELVARVRSHLGRLAALRELAIRDGLTRCFNHEFFQLRLAQEVERAQGDRQALSLAMLDVDAFKAINDRFGHRAGDRVLARVGSTIAAEIRASDLLGRYGGDEFAVLMVQAGLEEAGIICQRLCRRIAEQPFDTGSLDPASGEIEVTVSIGVAALEPASDTPARLVERADRALYAAKRGGRNQVRRAEEAAA